MLRKIFSVYLMLLMSALTGCNQDAASDKQQQTHDPESLSRWSPPVAGTLIDKIEERVTEDKLNEKYFRVTVLSTDESKTGTFLLKLEYGFNAHETSINLPEWINGIILKPVLKKGGEKYSCLLGFDIGDGKFHELYEIKVQHNDVVLKQTKGYYQTTN